jgi:hypothetical protein
MIQRKFWSYHVLAYSCSVWNSQHTVQEIEPYESDHDQQRSNRNAPTVKPEAPSAVASSLWWAERRPKPVEPRINNQVINL